MKFCIDEDILLFLEKAHNGSSDMLLMGKMPDGCKFVIMSFNENGTFTRYAGIPADSGFQLTMTNKEGVGQQLVEEEASNETSQRISGTTIAFNANEIQQVIDAMAVPIQVGGIINVQPANPMTPAEDLTGPCTQPIQPTDDGAIAAPYPCDFEEEDE